MTRGIIAIIAVAALAGCGASRSDHQAATTHPMHRGRGACALYEATLALGLLAKNPPTVTALRTAAAGHDWAKLVARAHAALHDAALGPARPPYRRLVAALDSADDSLNRRDIADFRTRLHEMLPTLKTTETIAAQDGLRCTVHSADGSASITFGG